MFEFIVSSWIIFKSLMWLHSFQKIWTICPTWFDFIRWAFISAHPVYMHEFFIAGNSILCRTSLSIFFLFFDTSYKWAKLGKWCQTENETENQQNFRFLPSKFHLLHSVALNQRAPMSTCFFSTPRWVNIT